MKCRFPHLSVPSRRSSLAVQIHPPPPLRKKALLIGIKKIRQDAVETQENDEMAAEEDVNAVPKPKKKKKQKDREKEKVPKAAELKGPHHDVMQMRELLIGALYH